MSEIKQLTTGEAVKLGAQSLHLFGRIFFPKTLRQGSPQFHLEMGASLYSDERYAAFMVFRGGAKTSLARVFVASRIAYGISNTIMAVSVSQDHAKLTVRWLKKQVEFNKKFTDTFGLVKGDKWTDEHLEIRSTVSGAICTVLAVGITGQIRGFNVDDYRPDLILADDVCNEENTGTDEQRKKLEALFYGGLLKSLAPASENPRAKCVMLQTPLHKDDLIMVAQRDPDWNVVAYGIFDEAGNSRWEERFPRADMEKEKEGHARKGLMPLWMREMECKIISSSGKSFDTARFKYWDVLPDMHEAVITIDPASSDSKKADDQVVMAVARCGQDIYVLEYDAQRAMMPDATANRFFDFMYKYRPLRAGVESIGYQRVLKWYLEKEMLTRRAFLTIIPIQDRRKKSDRIIQAISGYLSYGRIYIHPSMSKLVQQADDYDPIVEQKDDVLDALSMAIVLLSPAMIEDYIEGEYTVLNDPEDDYGNERPLTRRCP